MDSDHNQRSVILLRILISADRKLCMGLFLQNFVDAILIAMEYKNGQPHADFFV